jgi:hypothetical protein
MEVQGNGLGKVTPCSVRWYMIYIPNDTSISHYRPGEEGHPPKVVAIECATAAEVFI